jgi:hypothetical protein
MKTSANSTVLPFWAWGLTWNFIQDSWKFRLRMRTMVELEQIIWRTSKRIQHRPGDQACRRRWLRAYAAAIAALTLK